MTAEAVHTNRLAGETSPYLLQHQHNPVDWYPWGEEAFARARAADRPVLLSIGYAACHWCHVMAHESFEDPEIARQMNESFVCIKVDREERPDLDEIYMGFVQALTGHGGWPMTVFLTPEGKPFWGGTYFPPQDRHGMPGFPHVLNQLALSYKEKRAEVDRSAAGWVSALERSASIVDASSRAASLDRAPVDAAVVQMAHQFDPVSGGYGGAPKFPHTMDLSLTMRAYRRGGRLDLIAQVRTSLDKMAAGGIHDQVGGGFHRYSVDDRWAVPHFEKMLYDNALLARTYLEAHQLTGEERYARVARRTLEYVLAEMVDEAGGFWSSQDADSEGEEGKFFAWDRKELEATLGAADARLAIECFGVSQHGNFEGGKTVLYQAVTPEEYAGLHGEEAAEIARRLERIRVALYESRSRRVHPGTDDKVLACWNGLMISAMARGYQVLGEPRYLAAAERAARFILEKMTAADGALLRTYRAGQAKLDAYLEDYGSMVEALVDLYEASFDPALLTRAIALADRMIDRFWDDSAGAFHFTGKDHETLIVKTKPYYDGATPSGNSLAVMALIRLHRLTGRDELARKAEETLRLFMPALEQSPRAFPYMLTALDLFLSPPLEVALVGDPGSEAMRPFLEAAHRPFLPNRSLALARLAGQEVADVIPLLKGKVPVDGAPTAYVCRDYTCTAPLTTPDALERELAR